MKCSFLRKIACFLIESQGKDMYLILENDTLSLVDPMDRSVLHSQPIASIRVWGVGRDNGRWVPWGGATMGHFRTCPCVTFRGKTMASQLLPFTEHP